MRTVYTREAERDLDDIIGYIALDSPKAAEDVFLAIRTSVDQLQDFPELGHPGRLAGTRERSVVSLPYVVAYRHDGDVLTIVAIFHGARDLTRALAERRKQQKRKAPTRSKPKR